jgi:hypothetical protein
MAKHPDQHEQAVSLLPVPEGYAPWLDAEIVQQAVGQLPWGHNLVLLTKLTEPRRSIWP